MATTRFRWLLAATGLLLALPAGAAAAPTVTAAPPAAPALDVSTACFTSSGPDGKPLEVFGRRYAVGAPSADAPAIVLVHGVATTGDITYDPTPAWSTARWLAYAGYVVFTYDRPGYGRTPYAGSGTDITVDANQVVLHDLVGQVHAGSYAVGASTGTCRPGAQTDRTGPASARVALVGHSGGGFIVSSYPGRYHDVVAMVQANAPSGLVSVDPPGNAAIISAAATTTDVNDEANKGPIGDASQDGTAASVPAGYTGGTSRADCENFNFWRAGAVRDIAGFVCDPAHFVPQPDGETRSYVDQAVRNNVTIRQTGDVPVLLAASDHDRIMPGDANALEFSAWQESCACDVSQFILKDTGHFFAGHRSLAEWATRVTDWLAVRGVGTSLPAGVRPRAFPPIACGAVRATVKLGRAGRRARAISVTAGRTRKKVKGGRAALRITVPAGAPRTPVVVRVRDRAGHLTTTTRQVDLCRTLE